MKNKNLENSSKVTTYEILIHDTQNDVVDTTTYGYRSIEECKKDFGLYTSDIEKVIGIKKIEHVETEIKIEDL